MKRKFFKFFATTIRKRMLYGDCEVLDTGYFYPLIGRAIECKMFGLFWITYKHESLP